ncbi:MAG: N-acetyl-gamma-glutamyl-phosphate reductase, partial [Candidatus Kuenenbacteria bacterium]
KVKIAIIGGAGLASASLLKLLLKHPYAIPIFIISDSQTGKKVSEVHKCLRDLTNDSFVSYKPEDIVEQCDLVFLSKNHSEALEEYTAKLIKLAKIREKNIRFIDLSADFRLKNPNLYDEWYHFHHKKPELLKCAVYGLPELNADNIRNATLVANPGCYATTAILGLAPLTSYFSDNNRIIINAYSGVSGAGKTTQNGRNLFMDVENNIIAYKIFTHPHIPEIEQEIGILANKSIQITFIPHVVSFRYGIFTTICIELNKKLSWKDTYALYSKFYANKPFIRILKEGDYPEILNVEGTNFCDISIEIDNRTNTYVIMVAIDNIIKGASGQAIQNMNVMFGFNETEGLPYSEVLEKKRE